MITTFDPLSEKAEELLSNGEDVIIYDWHNALANWVRAVDALVRRGLWEVKQRHYANDPMRNFTVYGPALSAEEMAARTKTDFKMDFKTADVPQEKSQ